MPEKELTAEGARDELTGQELLSASTSELQQVAGPLSLGLERLKEIEVLRRTEESQRIELAVQQVREAVLQMKNPEDWSEIGVVLRRQLSELVAFDGAGIAIVNRERWSFYAYDLTESGAVKGELCEFLPRALDQAIKAGKPVYRRNRTEMEEWGDNIGPERKSVVDVPFHKGTLSLNSARENAFSGRDIEVLERFAGVIAEAHLRLEDLRAVQQALRREEAMGRVRSRVIAMRHLSEIGEELEKAWVEELRGLGIPVNVISLQFPAAEEGWFTVHYSAFLANPRSRSARLANYPWVQEVWESGKPVVVDRERLDRAGFAPEIQCILEVPLPTGGSLAVNTKVRGAFDEETIRTVQAFADLIAEGLQRLQDFEVLRQAEQSLKVEVAMQRVRNQILQMEREADWKRVVAIFHRELRELVSFAYSGINLVGPKGRTTYAEGTAVSSYDPDTPLAPALRQAIATGRYVYRRNREEMVQFGDVLGSEIGSVLDVPFAGGTAAINSREEEAFSERDIQVLEQFAQVLNEGHRRLEDLQNLALQEEQLHQAQKLEAIGQLATGVAHEINNPLTSVLGYSELLLRRELDPEVRQHLETIHQEGQRAREIAERLLQFVRRQKASAQPLSLNLLVEEVLELVRQQFQLDHVQLTSTLAPDLPLVLGQPGQLQQLLLALLQNSREAIQKTGKAGVIEVRTSRQGDWVRLAVEDDGPGVPEQIQERIFEPFFTTKEVGKGTGMGLSLCFAIAREHGGWLRSEPRGIGACLVLELPAGAGESPSAEEQKDTR